MIKTKTLFTAICAIVTLFLSAGPSYSANDLLPWLNFGNTLIWDENTSTLTNDSSTYVTSVTYVDNSTADPYSGDPVLGTLTYPPLMLYPVAVELSISYNNTADDYLRLVSADGSGFTWFSAFLEVSGPAPDPVGGPFALQDYMIKSDGLSVASGSGSQWADEFSSIIDLSAAYPAHLNIAWSGVSDDKGNGIYQVNAFSKVAVVPEPVSTFLFIAGGITLGLRRFLKRTSA